MTKLRRFDVTKTRPCDLYSVFVDGKPAKVSFTQVIVDECNKHHPDVDPTCDGVSELISAIISEINEEFNLTEQELNEYTQTLKYILED